MARRIAASRRVLCCSPEYASSHDLPRSVEEIAELDCFCYGNASVAPYWQFQSRQKDGEAHPAHAGSSYEYERTRVSGSALFIGIGVVNEQRKNRAEEL
jgi:hypothetical protein